ncbi:MAG: PD-(D/E)XK nuclease family protein [Puniceicoccales bacterium]|jgi:hypothetical protein|nr:PD-(D/E)XK nuclease family protein [Puniceicoccales bacterium]
MAGFIANHFSSIDRYLLHEVRSVEKFSELPSLILCHSPTEIAFLKLFLSDCQCVANNFHFYTFDTFISEILTNFFPHDRIIRIADLKLLAHNKPIQSHVLSQFFLEENFVTQRKIGSNTLATLQSLEQHIQALNWKIPRQALEKITANLPKLFKKCILFGFSPRDHLRNSFLKLLQKIVHHVTFFVFDWEDPEWVTSKLLENFFGPCENICKNTPGNSLIFQTNFAIVDDSLDAVTHIQRLISSQITSEKIGIICPSPSFAALVAHHLKASQIPFHSEFPMPTFSSRDNLVFAWCQWQMKNNWESFVSFCNFLQYYDPNLFPQGIDICKILNEAFDAYPAMHTQDLADFSKNLCLKNIVKSYPMLPENGPFHEFSQKTSPVIPEIVKLNQCFPRNFYVTKKAFLDYVRNYYFESKPSSHGTYPASIFLLDFPSATHLQFDKIIIFFQDISSFACFPIPSLQAKNIYHIAIKSSIAKGFMECYLIHRGKILDVNEMQSIYFPQKKNLQNHCKQYALLRKIHQIRNDSHSDFGIFEYTLPEIQCYSLPITAIERAYSAPEEVWYRHILKNNHRQLLFEKNKFEGILTHNFLHYSDYFFPSFKQFQQHIALKKQYFRQKFASILSQMLLLETLESAEEKASIIAKKLTAFERFSFIIHELDLCTPTTLSEGISIPLHGRIDCILSQYPFRKTFHEDNAKNNTLLIDFKAGTTSQNDLQNLIKKFTNLPQSLAGLQLVLYGLMLRTLGYKNIQILALNSDPYDRTEPIPLDAIIVNENFDFIRKYLKTLLVDGILGYGEPHPFGKTYSPSPITTLPPHVKAIQNKRQRIFCSSMANELKKL